RPSHRNQRVSQERKQRVAEPHWRRRTWLGRGALLAQRLWRSGLSPKQRAHQRRIEILDRPRARQPRRRWMAWAESESHPQQWQAGHVAEHGHAQRAAELLRAPQRPQGARTNEALFQMAARVTGRPVLSFLLGEASWRRQS